MERRVLIIGAGISGLMSCKYILEKGFHPIVFETESSVGGVWLTHMIQSTRLQTPRHEFRFSDFDWPFPPKGDDDVYPAHPEVLEYIKAYAEKFRLLDHIRLNHHVTGINYVGEKALEIMSWDQWSGTGTAFGSSGKWHVSVHSKETDTIEVHEAEFVILCTGRFSGLPNIPELPKGYSFDRFHGKVLHSMEYSSMDDSMAAELIKGERVAVIGSGKSAIDIAAECADANGPDNPCTVILRTPHWAMPDVYAWGLPLGYLYSNRFAELLVHQPGESGLHSLLATLLSPLSWAISKFSEINLRWKLPLGKYGMIPSHSFLEDVVNGSNYMLPKNFYDKVEIGSIILKKSKWSGFVEEGVILEAGDRPIRADVVILATGYKGDQKLVNMFESPIFQKCFERSPNSIVTLYRQTIHPRIPRLAIIGYCESMSNLPLFEIRCQWLAEFLDGNFKLPSIMEMEKDVKGWEVHMKRYGGKNFWRPCIGVSNIWANDRLCKDMGRNPQRKKGILAEWIKPYGAMDYSGLKFN